MLLAGLVLISLVVLFMFGDWRAPIVTSLCAVAVLAGSLGALVLTGKTLNISSYVGAIFMVGIVGEKAMFCINEAKLALQEGLSPAEAWRRVSRRRLRPVTMTIFATGFALAPLALALGPGRTAHAATGHRGHRRLHAVRAHRALSAARTISADGPAGTVGRGEARVR